MKEEPAFPISNEELRMQAFSIGLSALGLTKREYFANSYMPSVASCTDMWADNVYKKLARRAVQQADALIKELAKDD